MSDTLYEYNDQAEWNSQLITPTTNRFAQTFTIGSVGANVTHDITSVILPLYDTTANARTVYCAITATDGTEPTGADLCSASTTNAGWTNYTHYDIEFVFTPTVTLYAGTKYAIVLRGNTTHASYNIAYTWSRYATDYPGGQHFVSTDSGSTWGTTEADIRFKEYGIPAAGGTAGTSSLFMGMGTGIYTKTKGGKLPKVGPGRKPSKIGF